MDVADFDLPVKCRILPHLRKKQTKCIDAVDIKKMSGFSGNNWYFNLPWMIVSICLLQFTCRKYEEKQIKKKKKNPKNRMHSHLHTQIDKQYLARLYIYIYFFIFSKAYVVWQFTYKKPVDLKSSNMT